jgi:hypothetical protein
MASRALSLPTCRLLPVLLATATVLGPSGAAAATIVVRPDGTGDYPTIQTAIDAASDGDVIELADGMFVGDGNRDLEFLGKAIRVQSQSGDPTTCVIDCEGSASEPHRGVWFADGDDTDTELVEVTITGGYVAGLGTDGAGGGILCTNGARPLIQHCHILANHAESGGGGVSCRVVARPSLSDCVIAGNSTDAWGGGVAWGTAENRSISDCVVTGNVATVAGGGLGCSGGGLLVIRCTIAVNQTDGEGGGLFFGAETSEISISNSIVHANCAGTGDDVFGTAGNITFTCSAFDPVGLLGSAAFLVSGENVFDDPLLCDVPACGTATIDGDFRLHENSPCASDQAPPGCWSIGARPVGCPASPIVPATWGGLKALYGVR